MTPVDPECQSLRCRETRIQVVQHLYGWALIVDALLELRTTTTYPGRYEGGAAFVMMDALERMAVALLPPEPTPEPSRQPPRRRSQKHANNVRWLSKQLGELRRKPGREA